MNIKMKKVRPLLFIISWGLLVGGCSNASKVKQEYRDQIGDTPFDANLDDGNFKLCDATNVLHKRAYVSYTGGIKAMEEELFSNYKYQSAYRTFTGTFIIRFLVNCNNEAGRYRMQILDADLNKITPPENLAAHMLAITKKLNKWNHAVYKEKEYDGYRFITIKMKNGQLVKK